MESIYGKQAETLPLIMEEFARGIREFNSDKFNATGSNVYEHMTCRIKSEQSMREKCTRQSRKFDS